MFGTIKKGWSEFREFAFKGNMIDLAIAVVIGAAFSGVINSLVKDIIMPGISYVTSAAKATTDVVQNAAVHILPTSQPSTQPSTQSSTLASTQSGEVIAIVPLLSPLDKQRSELMASLSPDQRKEMQVALALAEIEKKSASAEEKPAPAPAPPAPPASAEEKAVQIDWKIGRIQIGHFIAELLNFMLVAFAVFLLMVKVLGSVMKRVSKPAGPSEPTTRECPYCLSNIPIKAKKCSHCTSEVPAA